MFFRLFSITRRIKNTEIPCESIEISTGFNVRIDDRTFDDADLNELSFNALYPGQKLVYSVTLPDEPIEHPMLTLYFGHCKAKVYIDDEEVYSLGQDEKRMFGYGFVYIPIEEDCAGKELRVEQTIMEKGEISSIDPIVITEHSEYFYRNFAIKYRLKLFIVFTLIMMGLIIGTVAFIFMIKSPEMLRLVFLAIAFFGMGTWIFCNYGLISLFTNDLTLKGYIEYPSFYTAPFFFTLYFEEDYHKKEKSFRRYIYLGILVAQGLFVASSFLMHLTDTRHLPKSLPVNHVLLIVSLGFLFYMTIRALRLKKGTHKPFLVGFVTLLLFSARDMFLFFRYYYIGHGNGERYESRMLSGILIFASAMFIDFFYVNAKRVTAEARAEAMQSMAYTDMMTGLGNRRGYEDACKRLNESKGTEVFGMISFDLNDLKKTNDNYGHEEGDKLLTDFSSLLEEVFAEKCVVCRMGGDEFLVVTEDVKKADPEKLTRILLERRREINKDRKPLPLSFAYGICTSDDKELDPAAHEDRTKLIDEVLKLSDKRMYECKVAIKAGTLEI